MLGDEKAKSRMESIGKLLQEEALREADTGMWRYYKVHQLGRTWHLDGR